MDRDFIAQTLRHISTLTTIEDVWASLCTACDALGFDRLIYSFSQSRTNRTHTRSTDVADALILSNHDPEYLEGLISSGLYTSGPNVKWVMENVGCASWREIYNPEVLTKEEQRVLDYNNSMGIFSGYTMSFAESSERAVGGLCISKYNADQATLGALWQEHGADVELLCNVAHLKLRALPYSTHAKDLSPRQREVLELVADGKTVQDIAIIMQRTIATVEKHLRLARETLQVETTAQAVHKASLQNQFFIHKP